MCIDKVQNIDELGLGLTQTAPLYDYFIFLLGNLVFFFFLANPVFNSHLATPLMLVWPLYNSNALKLPHGQVTKMCIGLTNPYAPC